MYDHDSRGREQQSNWFVFWPCLFVFQVNGKAGGTVDIEILARGEFWELTAGGLFAWMLAYIFYRFLDNSDGTDQRVRAVQDLVLEEWV